MFRIGNAWNRPEQGGLMKSHAIGDGHKRITCPGQYLADEESATTIVIWDPQYVDIPIRVTILTITPKDPKEEDVAYWRAIEKARESGIQPKILKDKAVYAYCKPPNEDGYVLHFFEVGMGNHYSIFSITVAGGEEYSEGLKKVSSDLECMIESLVERKVDEQFDCELQEGEKKRIRDTCQDLLKGQKGAQAWAELHEHYNKALLANDAALGERIGLVFGELLKDEVPSFHWMVKVDEYGRSRSLDFENARISIFPEAMILKRLDRKEMIDFHYLASGTIEAVENLYRKYQSEAQS
jgi:hypothetical protein